SPAPRSVALRRPLRRSKFLRAALPYEYPLFDVVTRSRPVSWRCRDAIHASCCWRGLGLTGDLDRDHGVTADLVPHTPLANTILSKCFVTERHVQALLQNDAQGFRDLGLRAIGLLLFDPEPFFFTLHKCSYP